MDGSRDRVFTIWRRTIAIGWPIAVQQTVNTLMRSVAILVTGLFSPVAVAAVGLTDLYAQVLLRIGHGLVGARCLQGTGDTRTSMLVNGSANVINIVLTVGLGFGIWVAPELGIVGVGVATALGRSYEAAAMMGAIAGDRTSPSIVRSWPLTITGQLVAVSVPNFAEGMSSTLVNFPFNAILLVFGTEVNAVYYIARRIFHQVGGPL